MFKFFVETKQGSFFLLPKTTLHHIKVARTRNKEFICVYEEKFYLTSLENGKAKIIKEIQENHEFSKEITLAPCLIKIKRFEMVVQKAAELGVSTLVPVVSANVAVKLGPNLHQKVERWNQIAQSACQQAFRNKKMVVQNPVTFEEIVKVTKPHKYLAHPISNNVKVPLFFRQDALFLVGPEGGFTREEVSLARKNSFEVVSLGSRVLRAETASIFMLSRVD